MKGKVANLPISQSKSTPTHGIEMAGYEVLITHSQTPVFSQSFNPNIGLNLTHSTIPIPTSNIPQSKHLLVWLAILTVHV